MKETIKEIAGGIGCCLVWVVIIGGCIWLWDSAKRRGEATAERIRQEQWSAEIRSSNAAWEARQAEDRQFRQRRAEEWRHQEAELDRALQAIEASRPLRFYR